MNLDIINLSLNKTKYVFWQDGESTLAKDAPFYCKSIPSVDKIIESGCNCAGLINILQLSRGLDVPGVKDNKYYAGGTYEWAEYLKSINVLELFDINKEYPVGSLLIREYRNEDDQGHLAVVYNNQTLLHCYQSAGITIDDSIKTSHNWDANGYYEFVCVGWFKSLFF